MVFNVNGLCKRSIPGVSFIMAAGILVYANTFHVPFTFDDHLWITLNSDIKSLADFYTNVTAYNTNASRFIGYLTLALNYHFGGLDVTGYHVVNLAIHLLTSLLVYILLRLTLCTPYFQQDHHRPETETLDPSHPALFSPSCFIPLFAALLFVVHPVQTQAVTYVIQRVTSLTTMFYLLSVILYCKARLSLEKREVHVQNSKDKKQGVDFRSYLKPWTLIGCSTVVAVLAMKTKEIAFTLPLAIVLYEMFFFHGAWEKRLFYLLPLLATLPIIPMTVLNLGHSGPDVIATVDVQMRGGSSLSRWDYLFTQFRVIITYLRLLVLPINQNLDYDYPVYRTFFTPPVFLSFLFITASLVLAFALFYVTRRETQSQPGRNANRNPGLLLAQPASPYLRLIAFGIFWFYLTLSVESSLIPIVDVIMEHRLYLPSFGAVTAFATAFYLLGIASPRPAYRNLFAVGGLVAVLVLGFAAYQRNHVWGDAIRLWRDTVNKSPNKARPYNNLGQLLNDAGKPWEAMPVLRKSLQLAPYFDRANFNLARSYSLIGQSAKAIPLLQKAITANPDFNGAYNDLGAALIKVGRYGEAATFLEQNLGRLNELPEAHFNLGVAYYNLGNIKAARRELTILTQMDTNLAAKLAALLP